MTEATADPYERALLTVRDNVPRSRHWPTENGNFGPTGYRPPQHL